MTMSGVREGKKTMCGCVCGRGWTRMFLLCRQMYLLCGFFSLSLSIINTLLLFRLLSASHRLQTLSTHIDFSIKCVFLPCLCMYDFEDEETLIFAFLVIYTQCTTHRLSFYIPFFAHIFFSLLFEPEKSFSLCDIHFYVEPLFFFIPSGRKWVLCMHETWIISSSL